MAVRLLALDLDGTLTNDVSTIPARTQETITAAMAQGVKVALATGRDYQVTADVARRLGLNAPVICYQGGLLRDYQSGETWLAEFVPLDVSRRLIKFARARKMPMVMFMADDNVTEFPSQQMQYRVAQRGTSLTIVNNLLSLLDDEVKPIKFLFVQPKRQNDRVYQQLEAEFGSALTVVRSAEIYVEAFWPSMSKGRALQILADRLQIPMAQTMAIGDHDNDISMLNVAQISVAMADGSPGARAAADIIAPPVAEEGVAWAIQTYILEANHAPDS